MGDGPEPAPPTPPSQQELDLLDAQRRLINTQIEDSQILRDLIPEYQNQIRQDREFQLRQQEFLESTQEEQLGIAREQLELQRQQQQTLLDLLPPEDLLDLQREVQREQAEQSLAALRGELDVGQGLRNEFDDAQQQLERTFRQRFGAGFETSTPFLQAQADLQSNRAVAFDEARHGRSAGVSANLASLFNQGFNQSSAIGIGAQQPVPLVGFPGAQTGGYNPSQLFGGGLALSGALSGIAGQQHNLIGLYQNDRQIANSYNLGVFQQQSANSNNRFSSIASFAGGLFGLFSDRRLKTNLKAVGKLDNGLTVYTFNWVHDKSGVTYLGLMADEVKEMRPGAVRLHNNGFYEVNYAEATV